MLVWSWVDHWSPRPSAFIGSFAVEAATAVQDPTMQLRCTILPRQLLQAGTRLSRCCTFTAVRAATANRPPPSNPSRPAAATKRRPVPQQVEVLIRVRTDQVVGSRSGCGHVPESLAKFPRGAADPVQPRRRRQDRHRSAGVAGRGAGRHAARRRQRARVDVERAASLRGTQKSRCIFYQAGVFVNISAKLWRISSQD